MSILQRVVDLLRLAADSGASEHEARNAAFQAARLIAQHGLRVVDARSSTATATHTTTETRTRTTSSVWRPSHPHYEEMMARERAREAARQHWERSVHEAHAEYERRSKEQPVYPWVAQEPSQCGSCWADIPTGSDCFYGPFPKHGWRCVACATSNAPPRPKPKSKRKKSKATSK